MKKATFEYMQKRYSDMCNLYWLRVRTLYKKSGLTKITFEQFYEWKKKDDKLKQYKTIMYELSCICGWEGEKSGLDKQPTIKVAKEFMHKFYNEIYQTEG